MGSRIGMLKRCGEGLKGTGDLGLGRVGMNYTPTKTHTHSEDEAGTEEQRSR